MKQSNRPLAAFTAFVLVSSALFTTAAYAMETTAKGNSSLEVFSSLKQKLAQELSLVNSELEAEMLLRENMDNTIRAELQDRIDNTTNRINALEARLPGLAAKVENLFTTVDAELTVLKTMISTLRSDMEREMATRNNLITAINQDMNSHRINLQSQINANNTRINDLYNQVAAVNIRVTNLNNFLSDIQYRLTALRNCVNAGGCVTQRAPSISLYNDIRHDAGWEWFNSGLYGNVWNTGISTSTYQYCAISGNYGMAGRDFYVYPSGGTWHMANEKDNLAGGDEVGSIFMNCLHIS